MRYNYAKPFPKILVTIFLLIVTVVIFYLVRSNLYIFDTITYKEQIEKAINIIINYGKYFALAIIILNVIELIDYIVNAKRDEVINANLEYMNNNIGIRVFFKHYFAPLFTKGPYMFASQEKAIGQRRRFINTIISIIKYIYWVVFGCLLLICFYYKGQDSQKQSLYINVAIIFSCINCNVFVYALYRILPLYEAQSYDLITYYSDGTSSSRQETHSNFIAIILVGGFVYIYYSIFYISCFANRLVRGIETKRFKKFIKKCDTDQSILSFYRYK